MQEKNLIKSLVFHSKTKPGRKSNFIVKVPVYKITCVVKVKTMNKYKFTYESPV